MQEIDFTHDLLPLKDKLFRLALRLVQNKQEAEDLTSETLIRVWNKRKELTSINNIEAYCYNSCRNLALDLLAKQETRNLSLEQEHIEALDQSFSSQEVLEQTESRNNINNIINKLPEQQRSIVQLRDIEGKSYKEIAEILIISEEVVKVNLFRARKKIKQLYEKIEDYGL